MFGIGMQELAIILIVALVVFGPKRLPEFARTMGRGLAEFRRASNELRHSFSLDADPPKPAGQNEQSEEPPRPPQAVDSVLPESDPPAQQKVPSEGTKAPGKLTPNGSDSA